MADLLVLHVTDVGRVSIFGSVNWVVRMIFTNIVGIDQFKSSTRLPQMIQPNIAQNRE
jgi:hypothetical protein